MPLPPPNDTQFIDPRNGLVFPWFTKPFLDQLITWRLEDKRVFEYGIGRSTLWWLNHAKEVVGVEADSKWIDDVAIEAFASNIDVSHWTCWWAFVKQGEVELKSSYVNSIYDHAGEFDLIIIDGSYRDECVAAALTKIKDGGIIICDNWDQDFVWDSIMAGRLLDPWEAHIFVQSDHTNHEGRPWKTAYWQIYKDENKLHGTYLSSTNFFSVKDAYESHRPMLWMALEHIKPGLVVEFGSGFGSTPLLERYCDMQCRGFISFETNPDWANEFKGISALVDDYMAIDYNRLDRYGEPVTLVFIDGAPGEQRAALLKRWMLATVIVIHDTEPEADYVYHLQDTLNSFAYRCDLIVEGFPQTTAVSNVYDFERWKGVTLGKFKFV